MSKRTSTLPTAPKPPVSFAPAIVIAENASLTGTHPISIGLNTVIHPRSKLSAAHGPITIGRNCIVSERSQVGLQSPALGSAGDGVAMGDGVVVEVGAVVEARRIGDGCVIEGNARLGKGAVLGKHCKIGPWCEVAEGEVVEDFTVIYANGLRRLDRSGVEDLKLKMVARQVEALKKLIPSNPAKFQ